MLLAPRLYSESQIQLCLVHKNVLEPVVCQAHRATLVTRPSLCPHGAAMLVSLLQDHVKMGQIGEVLR